MFLKQSPRDFLVCELLEFEEDPAGEFYIHVLKKTKLDTQEALSMLCRKTNVSRGDVAFAGLKDRQGHTEQFISVRGRRVEFKVPGLQLIYKGRSARAIHSKLSRGNRFRIVLRGLDRDSARMVQDMLPAFGETGYVNYFDDQRFGCLRHGQGFPMRDVLAGRYEKALSRLIARPSPVALGGDTKLKRLIEQNWGEWDICARIARGPLFKPVFDHLCRRPQDFAGAIQKLSSRTRLIQSFAYQSYIWNRAVSSVLEYLIPERGRIQIDSLMGELVSFTKAPDDVATKLRTLSTPLYAPDGAGGDELFQTEVERWLNSEQLSPQKCRDNTLPGMVWREEPRDLLVYPTKIYANSPERDEANRGASKIEVAFSLPRGVYATMLIKHLSASVEASSRHRGGSRTRSNRNIEHD